MVNPFSESDIKRYTTVVKKMDIASFDSGTVHELYSTFALTRDAEWVCRLFVLDMKEENEEGIGTFVEVSHVSPAKVNSKVSFEARLESVNGNEVICEFEAKVGDRIIAKGRTGQKILMKSKLDQIMSGL